MKDMSIEQKYEEIKVYFNHIIKGYLANDIKTLLNPSYELDKKEFGGCVAPLALSIISGIEQLGFLTNQKEIPEIEKQGSTELRIKKISSCAVSL